jgi:hypothetical protein
MRSQKAKAMKEKITKTMTKALPMKVEDLRRNKMKTPVTMMRINHNKMMNGKMNQAALKLSPMKKNET